MFIPTFIWFLVIFWSLIYAVHKRYLSSTSKYLLPGGSPAPRKSKSWSLELKNLNIKLETSVFNSFHENASVSLLARPKTRKLLGSIYDVGSVFGVLGAFGGIVVLGFTSYQTLSILLFRQNNEIASLHKRDLETTLESASAEDHDILVKALIPGITVPFWHSPILLVALWTAQCIHEIGHAIAAMIESTPLQSVGVSLTLFLPSAFVSLSPSLSSLSPRRRLRVIAAGAWHNLIVWMFIYALASVGLARVWHFIGWEDVASLGVAVVSVEEDSVLALHVKPGSVILALDDVELGNNNFDPIAFWEEFFEKSRSLTASPSGWCVDAVTFFGKYGGHFLKFTVPNDTLLEHTSDCCLNQSSDTESPPPPLVQLSCFVPTSDRQDTVHMGRCIDPVPVLAPSGQQQQVARCSSHSDCSESRSDTVNGMNPMECVQPSQEAQLLRITILPPPWEDIMIDKQRSQHNSHVVLWSGPRYEVYEQISPGRFRSRFKYLPAGIPDITYLFFDYLGTISLALYIFNLFALPFLDGSHFLHALLDLIGQTRSINRDLDMLEEGNEAGIDPFDFAVDSGRVGSLRRGPSDMRNNASLRSVTRAAYSAAMQIQNWVRWRKTRIETTIRYSTIALMLISGVGMICSSLSLK